jgi:hypothetical protein
MVRSIKPTIVWLWPTVKLLSSDFCSFLILISCISACKSNLDVMKNDLELLPPCALKCNESILCRNRFLWKGIQLKSKLLNEWKTLILVPPKPYKISMGSNEFQWKNHEKHARTKNKNVPIVLENNFDICTIYVCRKQVIIDHGSTLHLIFLAAPKQYVRRHRKMKLFCWVLEWPLLVAMGVWMWPDKGSVQLQKKCTTAIKFHNCKKNVQLQFHFTNAKSHVGIIKKMHNCNFSSQLQKNVQLKKMHNKKLYNCKTNLLQY